MNYFSIVCIGLKEDDVKDSLFKAIDPNVSITHINGYTYYDYNWIAWNIANYEAIDELMNYLEYLGRENFALLRVGEDSEDIDRIGSPQDFHMDIHTNIVHPPHIEFNKEEIGEDIE